MLPKATGRRVIIIVLDGVGCGALPDADRFGDQGSNTLGNLARSVNGLHLPHLKRLGLGNIIPIAGVVPEKKPAAAYGRMAERSAGKDSTIGHWELAGVISPEPFPVFPRGFPRRLIAEFERRIGRRTLGNIPASGTEIINRLGEKHLETGYPIVYTSADSVFQLAAHIDIIPLEQLYTYCKIARELLTGRYRVARVIARPFTGTPGAFYRTPARRDFSCPPPQPTLLDNAKSSGLAVVGIGKIDDLFAHQGLTRTLHSVNNQECINLILETLKETTRGLILANLVQFDMDWGHRNDTTGFARGLAEFDARLPEILDRLEPDDLLFITADHGCDPTTPSTDHSREYVPLLVYSPRLEGAGTNLGTRATFADLAQTVAEYLEIKPPPAGVSFLSEILLKRRKDGSLNPQPTD